MAYFIQKELFALGLGPSATCRKMPLGIIENQTYLYYKFWREINTQPVNMLPKKL